MTDEITDAVRDVLPAVTAGANAADEQGYVPDTTVDALRSAGLFRMLQPARFGGAEDDPVRFFRMVREVAACCASTGWLASVLGVHPWQLALFPERAQHEVWDADPDGLAASSYAPAGQLEPADDGYRLTGRWRFSSGCEHATWLLLGAYVLGPGGRPVDIRTVLVPAEQVRIVPEWDVVGLRGTASNGIAADDLFVPGHRSIRNYDQAQLRGPGQRVNRGALYRMPFATLFTNAVTAPLIGAARGGYRHCVRSAQERTRLSLGGQRFAEDAFAQAAVGRAGSEIDAAELQTDHNIGEVRDLARKRAEISMSLRLRVRRDQVRSAERARESIELLYRTAGGAALQRGNPIERAWRDVYAGSMHVANDAERALALHGKSEFGLDVEDDLV